MPEPKTRPATRKPRSTLTRSEAAVVALYRLGGQGESVDTEDIAIELETVAPGTFSWQKFPDRTDKELVRVALSDARLKGGYTVGSHSKGWMLTAKGMEFARVNSPRLEDLSMTKRQTKEEVQWERERARLLGTDAFSRLSAGEQPEDLSPDDVDGFFRLNIYVKGQARHTKVARIENHFSDDSDLGEVVKILAKRALERA